MVLHATAKVRSHFHGARKRTVMWWAEPPRGQVRFWGKMLLSRGESIVNSVSWSFAPGSQSRLPSAWRSGSTAFSAHRQFSTDGSPSD
jgi:hypothetical protein